MIHHLKLYFVDKNNTVSSCYINSRSVVRLITVQKFAKSMQNKKVFLQGKTTKQKS